MNEYARGLMGFWTDIDDENLLEVQKWHNCEHMTERVTIPGFLVGRRYRGVDKTHTYLMYYETTDTNVLQSEAYLHALNNSTPWTKKCLSFFKNNIRNIYELIAIEGKPATTEAPYLYIIRFNIAAEKEIELVEWLKANYLRKLSALSNVYRSRLYQIDEKISNIMTGEREIYGGGPGQQKYLLIFELASQYLPKETEWQRINEENLDKIQYFKNKFEEYSFLEFVLYAPKKS
ncbi:MAG: hypothetical protein HWN67_14820 [Candidatus Helarchaeota archaeon]|nr:hypothetical protein [Candidatus Helarchaeota archaeon]